MMKKNRLIAWVLAVGILCNGIVVSFGSDLKKTIEEISYINIASEQAMLENSEKIESAWEEYRNSSSSSGEGITNEAAKTLETYVLELQEIYKRTSPDTLPEQNVDHMLLLPPASTLTKDSSLSMLPELRTAQPYDPTQWGYLTHFSSEGTHSWTVPEDGMYNVIVVGGVGGYNSTSGSVAISQYTFTKGQVISGIQLTKEITTFQGMTAQRASTAPATGGNLYNLPGMPSGAGLNPGLAREPLKYTAGQIISCSCDRGNGSYTLTITASDISKANAKLNSGTPKYIPGGGFATNPILNKYTTGISGAYGIQCLIDGSEDGTNDGSDAEGECYGHSPAYKIYYGFNLGGRYGVKGGASSGDPTKDVGTVIIERMLYSAPSVTKTYNPATNTVSLSVTGGTGTTSITMGSQTINASSTTFTVANNGSYIISATNGSSVQSTTTVVTEIDKVAPSIVTTALPTTWVSTAQVSVTLTDQTAQGLEYWWDGIWKTYVNGTKLTINKNGKQTLKARDKWGQESSIELNVTYVDGANPITSYTLSPAEYTNHAVDILLNAVDDLSGLARITLPDGRVITP